MLNLYVVNGSEVGSEKYAYKLAWLQKGDRVSSGKTCSGFPATWSWETSTSPRKTGDVHDPKAWEEPDPVQCTAEREALQALLGPGLRRHVPPVRTGTGQLQLVGLPRRVPFAATGGCAST